MSNNYVQVPPNSSGVKLQTFENTISANVVDAEAMVPVDASGVPVTAAPGAAAPASGILVGGSDGTDLRALATDTGGQVKVLVENSPTVAAEITGHAGAILDGTAGTPSTGVLTVQGVSGGTALPVANTPAAGAIFEVSPTTAANTASNPFFEAVTDGTNGVAAVKAASTAAVATDKALVVAVSPNNTIPVSAVSLPLPTGAATSANQPTNAAQGSTTSGQTGILVEGAVSTNPPVYTNAQTSPLTLNTEGYLRVASVNGATAILDNSLIATEFIPGPSGGAGGGIAVDSCIFGGTFSGSADAVRQGWSKARMPTVFKTVQATASGNTAVWTPGSGNKFRLLKVFIEVTANASLSAGAVVTITFQDNTTGMPIATDVFIPTTAVTTAAGDAYAQTIDLGAFGILSAAANNVFNVNLSATLATGNVRIITMGTEE